MHRTVAAGPSGGRSHVVDRATNDPHYWNDRTRMTAHQYIIDHWHELSDGDVIDVEFILGEKSTRKISERHTTGEA